MSYSIGFKEQAVQKFLNRANTSVKEVARELGITSCTLYAWSQSCAITSVMDNAEKRPKDWKADEKFKAVIEFEGLPIEKRGEFLRSHGLHSDNIESWKKSMQEGLTNLGESKAERKEMTELKAQNKVLEKDLNRKDKALAEATALLVLKKKADLIWGIKDEE